MDKIAIINELYFVEKKNLTEIAQIIETSVSYISRILRKDQRYKEEKEKRKKDNLIQRRKRNGNNRRTFPVWRPCAIPVRNADDERRA